MNFLTWVIYLADVLPTLGLFLFIAVGVAIVVTAISFVVVGVHNEQEKDTPWRYPPHWKIIVALSVMLLVAIALPSRQTILLMAGSEGAEAVVTSPQAKELFTNIQEVIKSQLDYYKRDK